MPIVPPDKLDKFITHSAFEIGHEAMNMLVHFRDNHSSRERVIENVTRKLIDAMDTIEESAGSAPDDWQGDYLLGE